jgi:diguanylate cyclase (GGDEF)-like protein
VANALPGRLARPWFGFSIAGFAAIAIYFLVPGSQAAIYVVIGLAAAAAIVAGCRIHHVRMAGWWVLAAGLALYSIGDLVYTILVATTGTEPFPSVAEIPYLSGLILIVVGVGLLAGPLGSGLYRPALLDAALVATAGAFLAWPVLLDPLSDSLVDPVSGVLAMTYPILDLLLVGVLARHFLQPGWRIPSILLMAAGVLAWLVADLAYTRLSLTGEYVSGDLIDAGWLLAYVFVGAAALHPSMANVVPEFESHEATVSTNRLVLVGLAVGVTVVAFVLHGPLDHVGDYAFFGGGAATVAFLGTFRLLGSLRSTRMLMAEQEALQVELGRRARTDQLTGLPNRAAISDRLESTLAMGESAAVVFLDLDDFKRINDAFGHPFGDAFLREVADRLRDVVGDEQDIGRFGGDEFAIIVRGGGGSALAIETAQRILDSFSADVLLSDQAFRIQASIGIVCSERLELTAEEMLSRADIAMYRAKQRGGGSYAVFEPEMHEHALARAQLRRDLDGAVMRGEITPWFQPIFDVATERLVAVEALARWHHPTRGLVPPDEFIPIAELSGSIVEIDRMILQVAAARVAGWNDDIGGSLQLHVNITPREAADPGTVEAIAATLATTGLPAELLVVEVTETALIDEAAVGPVLASLKALGVRLSIDDFGSRYAVLTQLGRLPIDIVKLDRGLIEGVATPEGFRLLEGILRLAQSLRLETVAEGIEEHSVLPILRRLGCTAAQGYALGRPVPPAEFEGRLALWSRIEASA